MDGNLCQNNNLVNFILGRRIFNFPYAERCKISYKTNGSFKIGRYSENLLPIRLARKHFAAFSSLRQRVWIQSVDTVHLQPAAFLSACGGLGSNPVLATWKSRSYVKSWVLCCFCVRFAWGFAWGTLIFKYPNAMQIKVYINLTTDY